MTSGELISEGKAVARWWRNQARAEPTPATGGYGLTPRQRELLAYLSARDECPSFTEMRDALGLSSNGSVQRLIEALEAKGRIRRIRNRHRAIEVLRPVQGAMRIVNGPEHWDMRAQQNRAKWAREADTSISLKLTVPPGWKWPGSAAGG